ncbi:hypothetical protein CD58_04855 [Pseudomonas brassicacearum]|nr:hypothetical protein CD58_04855 [Pseudomonas brassicacearum]
MSDRDLTLLPHAMGDKRTKEVFALYLKRITGLAGRASASSIDGLDDGLSAARIFITAIATVADPVTVHV